MELIAVVAAAHPGAGDRYNLRQPDSVIRRYLKAARKAKALLILDIQPGRADFFTETKRLRKWLEEPTWGSRSTGVADGPGRDPGKVIGSVGAREVNATTDWLDQLERRQAPAEAVADPPVHRRHDPGGTSSRSAAGWPTCSTSTASARSR